MKSRTDYCPTDLLVETVLEKVVEHKADLLVITARPSEGSDAFLRGSFTRQLLRYAPCPVLAIRPENAGEGPEKRVVWHQGLTDSASLNPDS